MWSVGCRGRRWEGVYLQHAPYTVRTVDEARFGGKKAARDQPKGPSGPPGDWLWSKFGPRNERRLCTVESGVTCNALHRVLCT